MTPFGGSPWQVRVRPKSLWVPAELHAWPEIVEVPLKAFGTHCIFAAWAARFETDEVPRASLGGRGDPDDIRHLLRLGLWARSGADYRIRSMADLRTGRGRPGLIIRLALHVFDGPTGWRAGRPALGLYVKAASWSLFTGTPGYIERSAAVKLGTPDAINGLFVQGLWRVGEFGFYMSRLEHPIEESWSLSRDDERVDIPPELRRAVMDRDGNRCQECGSTVDLTLDHIIPWSYGGPDSYENLRVLCRPCNSSKGDRFE